MTRRKHLMFSLVLGASITAVLAWAQSVHYKKGPSCVDNGLTETCTGTLAGLGNGDVLVIADFPSATATTTCTNPGGSQKVPGQNPALPVDVMGSASIPKVKNGTVSFTVTTTPPENPTPQAAGCPNANWTASINDVTFNSGTITVQQPAGTTVLTTQVP